VLESGWTGPKNRSIQPTVEKGASGAKRWVDTDPYLAGRFSVANVSTNALSSMSRPLRASSASVLSKPG